MNEVEKRIKEDYRMTKNFNTFIKEGICVNEVVKNYQTIGCIENCEKCYKTAYEENMG